MSSNYVGLHSAEFSPGIVNHISFREYNVNRQQL